MASDLLFVDRMRLVRVLVGIVACALLGAAQSFPQGVDLVQRIDQLYPWLNVVGFDVDAQGDIYLAGSAKNPIPDILTTHFGPLGGSDIVVIKFDPLAQRMLYAVAIGGSGDDQLGGIRVDALGNVYLIAFAGSTDFPIVFRQGLRNRGPIVLKLNSTGTLAYNTVLSWAQMIYGFNVDAAGTVYLSGQAISGELPTSSTSYLASPPDLPVSGFVAKLNSSGQALDAATYIPGAVTNLSPRADGGVVFSQRGIGALDSSLSRLLFFIDPGIETLLTGSFAPLLDIGRDNSGNIYVAGRHALRKYAPDGQLLYSRDFPAAIFMQFGVTRSGSVYLFGMVPPSFPTRNATQTCAPDLPNSISGTSGGGTWFLMVIGPDGETRYATYMVEEIDLMSEISASNGPYALAETNLMDSSHWRGILRLNPDEIPSDHTSAACLTNAATLQADVIAPGTIMALFGYRLGPDIGASPVAENGVFPFNVAGTTLTVDGKPAPILYAQNSQINFVVPWSLRTDQAMVPVCVTAGGDTSCLYAPTFAVAPGFFAVNRTVAAINQDGTINSQEHPAKPGSYLSVYFTGGGMLDGVVTDGGIAGLTLQRLTAKVSASFVFKCAPDCFELSPVNAPVLFAGAVPTLLYGANVAIIQVPSPPATAVNAQVTLNLRPPGRTADSTTAGYLFVKP